MTALRTLVACGIIWMAAQAEDLQKCLCYLALAVCGTIILQDNGPK